MDCLVTLDHPALQVQLSRFISAIVIYELTGFSPGSHERGRSARSDPHLPSRGGAGAQLTVSDDTRGTAGALARTLLILALFYQLLAHRAHRGRQAHPDRRGRPDPTEDAIRQIAITIYHRLGHAPAGNKNPLP